MRVEQCIDIDGEIYYLGESVKVNGYAGYISEIGYGSLTIGNSFTMEKRIIRYSDINEIRKRDREKGEIDFREFLNKYL